jgi:hypothetical protein
MWIREKVQEMLWSQQPANLALNPAGPSLQAEVV